MTDTVRVLVVDDHDVVRAGLRAVIGADPGLEVVGEASDGVDAVAAATALQPDVIVIDLQMPRIDGLEAIPLILANCPETAILVLSIFEDDESLFAALSAGAAGYILKGADRRELRAAIASVASGQSVFGAGVARQVLRWTLTGHNSTNPFPELTHRERQVLDHLVEGLDSTQIARHLAISNKTVRNNVSSILNKLHVVDRAAVVELARQREPDKSGPAARSRSPQQ